MVSREKIVIAKANLPKKILKFSGSIPGRVMQISSQGVLILCGSGQIIVDEITDERGKILEPGDVFSSLSATLGVKV